MVSKIKTIKGARWHPDKRYWTIDDNEQNIKQLMALFSLDQSLTGPELLEKVLTELKLVGYSLKTRKVYIHHVQRYINFLGIGQKINEDSIRKYLVALVDEFKVSRVYHDQAVSAIKFMCSRVLKLPRLVINLSRPKKEQKLPTVLAVLKYLRYWRQLKMKRIRPS